MAKITKKDLDILKIHDLEIWCTFMVNDEIYSGRVEPNYFDEFNNVCMIILAEDLFTGETEIVNSLPYPTAHVAYIPIFHVDILKINFPHEISTEHLAMLTHTYRQILFEVSP